MVLVILLLVFICVVVDKLEKNFKLVDNIRRVLLLLFVLTINVQMPMLKQTITL
jgi:hypothetical protein